jgi:hypothetical protein
LIVQLLLSAPDVVQPPCQLSKVQPPCATAVRVTVPVEEVVE